MRQPRCWVAGLAALCPPKRDCNARREGGEAELLLLLPMPPSSLNPMYFRAGMVEGALRVPQLLLALLGLGELYQLSLLLLVAARWSEAHCMARIDKEHSYRLLPVHGSSCVRYLYLKCLEANTLEATTQTPIVVLVVSGNLNASINLTDPSQ